MECQIYAMQKKMKKLKNITDKEKELNQLKENIDNESKKLNIRKKIMKIE